MRSEIVFCEIAFFDSEPVTVFRSDDWFDLEKSTFECQPIHAIVSMDAILHLINANIILRCVFLAKQKNCAIYTRATHEVCMCSATYTYTLSITHYTILF